MVTVSHEKAVCGTVAVTPPQARKPDAWELLGTVSVALGSGNTSTVFLFPVEGVPRLEEGLVSPGCEILYAVFVR
jgi:hypothetical protein